MEFWLEVELIKYSYSFCMAGVNE